MRVLSHPNLTVGMKSLQSNVVYKLLLVNITAISLPRVYIDYKRNQYAGEETAFYQGSGILSNYGLMGLLGLGTAHIINKTNNKFNVNTSGWVNNDIVDALSHVYQKSIQPSNAEHDNKDATLRRFLKNSLANLEGIDSFSGRTTRLSPEKINWYAGQIKPLITQHKPATQAVRSVAKSLSDSLGTFDRIAIVSDSGNRLGIHPEKFIQQLSYLGHEFQKGYRSSEVETAQNNVKLIAGKLQSANKMKSLVSLATVSAFGFGSQFLNRWITLKRTGNSNFVGYPDFDSNKHNKQHNQNESTTNGPAPVRFGGGLASSQFLPTVNQLKILYFIDMLGALAASRGLDEAREFSIKWGFSYLNFLFIPNFVENAVAHKMGNKHIFTSNAQRNLSKEPFIQNEPSNGFQYFRRLFREINQSKIRSYQDIEVFSKRLGEELSPLNNQDLKEKLNGVVRSPETLIRSLHGLNPEERKACLSEAIAKELNGIKNTSIISGLLYSCVTLGIGLNLLNILITNHKWRQKHAFDPDNDNPFQGVSFT